MDTNINAINNVDIMKTNRLLRALYGVNIYEVHFLDGNINNLDIDNVALIC